MVVEALYHNGFLKLAKPIDLTDGEWVELEITRRLSSKPAHVVSLKGIWSQHIQSNDEGTGFRTPSPRSGARPISSSTAWLRS